jgi:hypothetical protein
MLNFIFRKYHYFIITRANLTSESSAISPKVYKFAKRYFFFRGRRVEYFEPFTSKETQETYIIIGTAKGAKTVNRNCLIFLLEIYAALTTPNEFTVSNDFKKTVKQIKDSEIIIYRVRK